MAQPKKTRLIAVCCALAVGLALVIYLNIPAGARVDKDALKEASAAAASMAAAEPKTDPNTPPPPPPPSTKPAQLGGGPH